MNIIPKGTAPIKRAFYDETEEWKEGSEKICLIYRKEYEFWRPIKKLSKVTWLRYIDSMEYK